MEETDDDDDDKCDDENKIMKESKLRGKEKYETSFPEKIGVQNVCSSLDLENMKCYYI